MMIRMRRTWLAALARPALLALAATVATTSTGCHNTVESLTYNHTCQEWMARKKASWQAWYVWHQCRDQCSTTCEADYKRGFIAGFVDCAMGGDGCAPVIPPRRYWRTGYQSATGHESIAAWYQGYPLGVRAAAEVSEYRIIPTTAQDVSGADYEAFRQEFYQAYDAHVEQGGVIEGPVEQLPVTPPEIGPETAAPMPQDPQQDYDPASDDTAPTAPKVDDAPPKPSAADEALDTASMLPSDLRRIVSKPADGWDELERTFEDGQRRLSEAADDFEELPLDDLLDND